MKDLPGISEKFRQGEISYSKVRAMTRVATEKNEEYLLMIARHGTAAHVERLVQNRKSTRAVTFPLKRPDGCHVMRVWCTGWRIKRESRSVWGAKPGPFHLLFGAHCKDGIKVAGFLAVPVHVLWMRTTSRTGRMVVGLITSAFPPGIQYF